MNKTPEAPGNTSPDISARLVKFGQRVEDSMRKLSDEDLVNGSTSFPFLRGEESLGTVTVGFERGYYKHSRDLASFSILIRKKGKTTLKLSVAEETQPLIAWLDNKHISISDERGRKLMEGIIRDLEYSLECSEKAHSTDLEEERRRLHESAMDALAKF